MSVRAASHAGSWYTARSSVLSRELDEWLSQVPNTMNGSEVPIPGARIIIAPHAGYSYSGPAAAWAYKCLDLSNAKRIFLLGPSHTFYLSGCAISSRTHYATPLGDLRLDEATIHELKETGKFDAWNPQSEEDEHSLEMHLPYIYKMCDRAFESPEDFPFLVPILVGSTSAAKEKIFGKLLSSYLGDPSSVFVISSDFCHWGTRFQYTYYLPASPSGAHGRHLTRQDRTPTDPPIHESIGRIDKLAMDAVESGEHDSFLDNLKETGNTVCGRHPIGIAMAAVEELKAGGKLSKHAGLFKFVRYERSSDVENIRDSSVSYASGVAIL